MKGVSDWFEEFFYFESSADEFAAWAFGEDFRELDSGIAFMEAWNRLHGDKLMLRGDNCIEDDAPKMVQLWKGMKTNNKPD